MKRITVSSDNFTTLLEASVGEEIQIGHVNGGKQCRELVVLKKIANSMSNIPEVEIIECAHQMDFGETLMRKFKQGYRISSTGCSDSMWRAVLIKEVSDDDKN